MQYRYRPSVNATAIKPPASMEGVCIMWVGRVFFSVTAMNDGDTSLLEARRTGHGQVTMPSGRLCETRSEAPPSHAVAASHRQQGRRAVLVRPSITFGIGMIS